MKELAALGALGAAQQHRDEAQAELGRLNTLAAYENITAPFDGIITNRYADLGSLIQAGTSSDTQSLPLVQLVQYSLMRLRFPVPEAQTPLIEDGRKVEVTEGLWAKFNWWFNRRFHAFLDRFDRVQGFALARPAATVIGILGLFCLSFTLLPALGLAYFPRTG
jgi:multidrug efflux pump subunit AcrA (membrane-fusion protein)